MEEAMINRRSLMAGLGAAAMPVAARAQENYPTRPIAMMVGFAPGGGTDIVSRLMSPQLQEELGQPVTVENRPGASGTLAAGMVARAKPDGYTLLTGTVSSQCTVAPLMRPPPYDQLQDFTPLMLVGTLPLVMVVRADSPARDVASLRAYAQEKPDGLNYGTSGVATQQHLASEMLARQGRVKMTHIPYRRTAQSVNAPMAGAVDVDLDTLARYLPHIRRG